MSFKGYFRPDGFLDWQNDPIWDEPIPEWELSPEQQAKERQLFTTIALLAAGSRVAKQRGTTVNDLFQTWASDSDEEVAL